MKKDRKEKDKTKVDAVPKSNRNMEAMAAFGVQPINRSAVLAAHLVGLGENVRLTEEGKFEVGDIKLK